MQGSKVLNSAIAKTFCANEHRIKRSGVSLGHSWREWCIPWSQLTWMVYPMVTVDVNGVSHSHSWREWCIPWSQLTWMVYPMVTVDVNGVKCWALLDTGAGSSYASSTLLDCLHLRPIRQQFKRIEIMFGTSNKAIDIYGLQIRSVDSKFILEAEVHEVDHKELSTLKNPKCTEIMAQFSYLHKLADVIKCLLGNTEVIFPRSRQDWILMHLFKPTLWSGIYPHRSSSPRGSLSLSSYSSWEESGD